MKLRFLASALCLAVATSGMAAASAAPSNPAASAADPRPGAPGAGDPYFSRDGNGGYDVDHYTINNRMRLNSGKLTGSTRIKATATHDLSSFNVDFLLNIKEVKVNGRAARWSRQGRKEVTIKPASPIADGKAFGVLLRYQGRPRKISWLDGQFFANRVEALAVNQPHIATWWFPANDHPRDKATYDISLTVPRGNKAISNGRLVEVKRGRNLTKWHWRSMDRMASYLAFFAAGKFKIERGKTKTGTPYTYAVSRRLRKPEQKESMRLLRKSGRVHSWLEKQLGEYPFAQTGGVVTSLDLGFALENQTRPVYPQVGADETGLVVHELAHQWMGDSLSVDQWRDIWLNEGWASWFEAMWGLRSARTTPKAWLREQWSSYGAKSDFWKVPIDDPGAKNLFDQAVYDRGAMTIQALRQRVGEKDFGTLTRTWVTRYRDSNVSTRQFIDLSEEISGEDLDGFFKAWLTDKKRPASTAENGL